MDSEDDQKRRLYIQNRAILVSYAARFVQSREAAEEIVQEAFAKLLPGSLNGVETPVAYLRTVVRNLAINHGRKQKYEVEQATAHAPDWIQPLPVTNPEQQALLTDQMRVLVSVLMTYPAQTRIIIEMNRFDGYTLQEIAARLDMSVTTVHRILTNAISDLTRQLGDHLK